MGKRHVIFMRGRWRDGTEREWIPSIDSCSNFTDSWSHCNGQCSVIAESLEASTLFDNEPGGKRGELAMEAVQEAISRIGDQSDEQIAASLMGTTPADVLIIWTNASDDRRTRSKKKGGPSRQEAPDVKLDRTLRPRRRA